mgnify:CR=1 FL=1|jgi:hypothetical protein
MMLLVYGHCLSTAIDCSKLLGLVVVNALSTNICSLNCVAG